MTSPSRIGYFIGMALADVRHFFHGRQAVPCLVDWEHEPDGDPDVTDGLTPSSRPKTSDDLHVVAERRDERYRILFGPVRDSSAPTAAELNNMKPVEGVSSVGFNFAGTVHPDTTAGIKERAEWDDDCCPDYEVDCCIATDTIGEFEGKA